MAEEEKVEEVEVAQASEETKEEPKKKNKIKLIDRTIDNDIKYRGPLSYQGLRIFAWAFLVLSQIGVVLSLFIKTDATKFANLQGLQRFFSSFADIPFSLFILANFAFIFQKKNNYKKMLIFYGGIALALYITAIILINHFGIQLLSTLSKNSMNYWDQSLFFGTLLTSMGTSVYVLNIFVDLFLCSLSFFFMEYKPKKHFKGKKILIFRLFVLIPILYQLGGIILKYSVVTGQAIIPYFVFFLLPGKPVFMYFAFVFILLFMKRLEFRHFKRHQSHELLKEFETTNAHSLIISIYVSVIFVISALLDFAALFIYLVIFSIQQGDSAEITGIIVQGLYIASASGIGTATGLIFVVPFALLFSYSKKPKNEKINKLIPIAGLALIVLVYAEGLYQLLLQNLSKIADVIDGGDEEEPELFLKISAFINNIKSLYQSTK